jgi:hypothetical protein
MNTNRIRNIARRAVGTTMLASALGLTALGASSMANAAPASPQAGAPAPQAVCWFTHHPELGWWYC